MMLSYRNVTKAFGEQEVLKDINLDIAKGERIGVVGRNGAGKTTLANIIFGLLPVDSGTVLKQRSRLIMAYLEQSARFKINTVDLDDEGIYSSKGIGFAKEIGSLKNGVTDRTETESDNFLSGGERTRLALSRVFLAEPDLLIMDEPTNHLDFQGIDRLIDELEGFSGAVLIISHDRYFLDRTIKRIVEIDAGNTKCYPGNYTFYRDQKRKEYETKLHQYINEQKKKKHIEEEIERVKQWSAKAHRDAGKATENKMGGKEFDRISALRMDRRVKSKIKRLSRMESEGVERPKDEPELNFLFGGTEKHGRRMLEAKSISKVYGDKILFQSSSFYFQRGDKIGVLGPNGCGKDRKSTRLNSSH